MPVKDSVELTDGKLYILNEDGSSDAVEIGEGELVYTEEEYFEDGESTISISAEPFTFEAECSINRDWTLVKCQKCGYHFPVTIYATFLYGHDNWLCPLHAAEKRALGGLPR